MSAFMHSDRAYGTIVAGLRSQYQPFNWSPIKAIDMGPRQAEELVKRWWVANRRAVLSRYDGDRDMCPEDLPPERFQAVIPPALVALYKLIRSVIYQCSESVPDDEAERHDAAMAEMEAVSAHIACHIVSSSPAYDQAAWS